MLYFLTRINVPFLTAMESRALRETQAGVALTMPILEVTLAEDTTNSVSEMQTTFSNNSSVAKTLLLRFSTMILGVTFSAEEVIKEVNRGSRRGDKIRLEWAEASLTIKMISLGVVLAVDRACSSRWAVWEAVERKASALSSHLVRVVVGRCQGQAVLKRKLSLKMGVRWQEPKKRRLIEMGTQRQKLLRSQTTDEEIALKTNLWSKGKHKEVPRQPIKWLEMDRGPVAQKAIKRNRALANITIGEEKELFS